MCVVLKPMARGAQANTIFHRFAIDGAGGAPGKQLTRAGLKQILAELHGIRP